MDDFSSPVWFRHECILWALTLAVISGCTGVPRHDSSLPPPMAERISAVHQQKPAQPSAFQDEAAGLAALPDGADAKHSLVLLDTGDDALLARIHLIRAATEYIDIQTFIWDDDAVSAFLFDELATAARRGVKVRILADALMSRASAARFARMATAHRNLQFCLYRPFTDEAGRSTLDNVGAAAMHIRKVNRRMHNKLFLVDKRIGIVGGRNYEDKYYDRHERSVFRDREVLVIGPCTEDMATSFNIFWEHSGTVFLQQFRDVMDAIVDLPPGGLDEPFTPGEAQSRLSSDFADANLYRLSAHRPQLRLREADDVKFVFDIPRKFRNHMLRNAYRETSKHLNRMVAQAQDRIVVQTPYLIYDRPVLKAFKAARKNGPDLRIVVSSNSLAAVDHLRVYALSFRDRKRLFRDLGLDIYEFRPHPEDRQDLVPGAFAGEHETDTTGSETVRDSEPTVCVHAKTMVVDGRVVKIGSHNFDPRSRNLNTECAVIIDDSEFASHVEKAILRDTRPGNSWVVGRKEEREGLISRMSGLIATVSGSIPFFDVWPYRYTSVFELRTGKEPVPPRHPDFYDHYRDVGQFPGVDSPLRTIHARLVKAFAGWSRPLM